MSTKVFKALTEQFRPVVPFIENSEGVGCFYWGKGIEVSGHKLKLVGSIEFIALELVVISIEMRSSSWRLWDDWYDVTLPYTDCRLPSNKVLAKALQRVIKNPDKYYAALLAHFKDEKILKKMAEKAHELMSKQHDVSKSDAIQALSQVMGKSFKVG